MRNDVDTEHKDLWLNQYLYADTGPLRDVVEAVIDEVLWDEQRTRKRKAKDLLTFRLVVEVIVANLSRVILLHPEGRPIVVARGKGRNMVHDNPAIPRLTFVQTLDLLKASGFLRQTIGIRGTMSTVAPTSRLSALVLGFGVHLGCFRRDRNSPTITVKPRVDRGHQDEPSRSLVRFRPTEETEALGARVARINDFLGNADLGFIPDGGDVVDTEDRLLRRSFTVLPGQGLRFDQVGRLWGGFWQGLKKDRRGNLLIDGEPIADLDFVSLHPRLAYHHLGRECPSGDLYDLTGILPGYVNTNPDHRDGVKRGLCSLFNGGRAGGIVGLPSGTTPRVLRAALVKKHPGLVSLIEPPPGTHATPSPPLGYRLMYLESEILLAALERLMSFGIVALPSHDGLFVAQSNAEIAQEAMRAASMAVLGVSLPVKAKAVPGPISAILQPIHSLPPGELLAA